MKENSKQKKQTRNEIPSTQVRFSRKDPNTPHKQLSAKEKRERGLPKNYEHPDKFLWTSEELHKYTKNRFINMTEFTIPREVMDDNTLSPGAKIVYGVLRRFPTGADCRVYHIAGLAGLSSPTVSHKLKELEKRNLVKRKKGRAFYSHGSIRQMPNKYYVTDPPKRVYKDVIPTILLSNIDFIENKFREYFREIEI